MLRKNHIPVDEDSFIGEQSHMSEPQPSHRDVKGKLLSFLWHTLLVLCASTIIASALFIVFLNLVIRGEGTIGPSDVPFVWVIPFLTCLAAGGATGKIKNAVKVAVPIMFFSITLVVVLSSLPVVLGYVTNVYVSNQFVMSVISTDFYVFILMIFTIFAGLMIGAFFGAGS